MPDTPNYDYLKPVLGEELFGQFAEKMAAAQASNSPMWEMERTFPKPNTTRTSDSLVRRLPN